MSEVVDIWPLGIGTKLTLKAGCVLIRDGARHLLVDPGRFPDRDSLEQALAATAGIGVADLDVVFFTHLHFDHYDDLGFADVGRVALPAREMELVAELQAHRNDPERFGREIRARHDHVSGLFLRQFVRLAGDPRYDFASVSFRDRLWRVEGGAWLGPGVQVVDLPGHSVGHLGLELRSRWGRTVVAGDAVLSLEDWQQESPTHHLISFDAAAVQRTRRDLADFDCVIPGHGAWFAPSTGTELEHPEAPHG